MEPTLKKYSDGSQYWYLSGDLHREDGPAVIFPDGSQAWFLNGKYHREDGPAVIYSNGNREWYLSGKVITYKVYNWAKERNIDLNNMSDMDKMVLKTELKMWK
jgi:hypothetical protein